MPYCRHGLATAGVQRMTVPIPATDEVDVLVVDDDDAVRSSMAEVVRSAGYSAEEASGVGEALAILQTTAVGVMLLDIQMPKVDGLQLLTMFDDLPPVVVVSGLHRDALSVPPGADVFMFLRKPVPPDELLAVVAQALATA